MNKFGLVLGATVVATLAGCKDPDYVSKYGKSSQNEVKNAETEVSPAKPAETPIVTVTDAKTGEKVADVKTEIRVETIKEPPAQPIAAPAPAEPAYTMYTVRRGDYLAKISKRYNLTINSIKRLNPQMKGDTVCVGQQIKLPGVIDVGVAPVEAPKATSPRAGGPKRGSADYTGATVEYVVRNGDTLGGVAYGHGINIRQLKKLNNLTGDNLRIGQKLKVPANGKSAPKKSAKAAAPAPAPAASAAVAAPAPTAPAAEAAPAPAAPAADAAAPAEETPSDAAKTAAAKADAAAAAPTAAPAVKTYVVQEGEDMAGVSVAWGVTASQIRELNNMGENDQLKPGQTIRLPAEADQQ